MASINGDWFHSRSSSNLEELLTVRTLVLESQKPEYIGFSWSGGRNFLFIWLSSDTFSYLNGFILLSFF